MIYDLFPGSGQLCDNGKTQVFGEFSVAGNSIINTKVPGTTFLEFYTKVNYLRF